MINAAPTPGQTPTQPATTPPVTPPSFPTHNPAQQHKDMMSNTPAVPAPTAAPISTAPIQPAKPKFPDPTKTTYVKADGTTATSGDDKKDGGSDKTKPKRKINMKMILGVVVLLFIVLGSGAGFYLSQQTQDLRQQAYTPGGPAGCCRNNDDCPGNEECSVANGACAGFGDKSCAAPEAQTHSVCRNNTCAVVICEGNDCSNQCSTNEECVGTEEPPASNLCPDNVNTIVWCATFDCSTTGDVNGDGQCTSADGVQAQIREGSDCPNPSICGQIDMYKAGPTGQNWDAFCGSTRQDLQNCPGGGGTPTPTPSNEPPTGDFAVSCTPNQEYSADASLLSYDISVSNISYPNQFGHSDTFISLGGTKSADTLALINFLGDTTWGNCAGDTWCGYLIKRTTGAVNGTYSFPWLGSNDSISINGKSLSDISTFVEANLAETYELPIGANLSSGGVGNDSIGSYKMDISADACAQPVEVDYQCNSICTTDAQCQATNPDWYCKDDLFEDSTCRLVDNPSSTTCEDVSVYSCGTECVIPANGTDPCTAQDATLFCHNPSSTGADALFNECRLIAYPEEASCTAPVPLTCDDTCDPDAAQDLCALGEANLGKACTTLTDGTSKCRLTEYPELASTTSSCDPAPLVCGDSCDPDAAQDLCNVANNDHSCDVTSETCRLTANPTDLACLPAPGAVACNEACTTDAECQLTNSEHSCDATSDTCRLTENPGDINCQPVPPACNETCSTNAECQNGDPDHICIDNVCRLEDNPTDINCQEAVDAPGCNDLCVTNADCSDSQHICVATADGSERCRLSTATDSTSCVLTTSTPQPELPPELPETGPGDWLNWLKAGIVTIGVGAALFFLL